MKKVTTLSIIICGILASSYTNKTIAEIYKWVDEQGKVHYGDHEAVPENTKTETVQSEITIIQSVPITEHNRSYTDSDDRKPRNSPILLRPSGNQDEEPPEESVRDRMRYLHYKHYGRERYYKTNKTSKAYKEKKKRTTNK